MHRLGQARDIWRTTAGHRLELLRVQDPTALPFGGGSLRIFQELVQDHRDLTVDDVRRQLGEFPRPMFVDELSARVEGAPCTGLGCYRAATMRRRRPVGERATATRLWRPDRRSG